jgi:hypothetical protein
VAQSANIRAFRRTSISPREQLIGGAVLLGLLAIGSGILIKGSHYDPATYTGDAEALESTRQAVEGKAATLRNEVDLRAYEAGGNQPDGMAATMAIPAFSQRLAPMGPTENYTEDTLFEKINGRAPAYFEYNFQELNSRSFSIEGLPGQFLDIYLFRMDSPLNAFGIFSAERDPTASAVDFVMDGYRSEMGYFLRIGDTYAQILASSTATAVMDAAGVFAHKLAEFLPENTAGMEGRLLLPSENQVPGSLTFINDNAYGQAVLTGVFEAQYEIDGNLFTRFAQTAPNAATAQSNWEVLKEFYSKYGTVEQPDVIGVPRIFAGDMFGEWSIIYTRDTAVSGIMNTTDKEAALAFLLSQLPSESDYSSGY